MSEFRLRTLANFASAAEAGALQSALEMQGIACTVNNAETVSNLWHLSNAIGGISVQVAEQDWAAAQAVIQATHGGEPWVCPSCGANVDAGFDLCWRCSADPQLLEVGPADECSSQDVEVAEVRAEVRPEIASATPEAASTVSDTVLDDLSRAWKCAVVGGCLCGVPNVYSLLNLLRINYFDLPQEVRWKYVAAFLVDVLVLLGLCAFVVSR